MIQTILPKQGARKLRPSPYLANFLSLSFYSFGSEADKARQNPTLSAVTPIADKRGRGWNVRFAPLADIVALFDHLAGAG